MTALVAIIVVLLCLVGIFILLLKWTDTVSYGEVDVELLRPFVHRGWIKLTDIMRELDIGVDDRLPALILRLDMMTRERKARRIYRVTAGERVYEYERFQDIPSEIDGYRIGSGQIAVYVLIIDV